MKTYSNEQEFVKNFAADVKAGENEFSVNGKTFTCTGKNVNKHGQSEYMTDLKDKAVTITVLKKILGITWTAERTTATDNKAETSFILMSDDDIKTKAASVVARISDYLDKAASLSNKYGHNLATVVSAYNDGWLPTICDEIVDGMIDKRNKAAADKAAKDKAAKDKAQQEAKDKAAKAIAAMQEAGLSSEEIKSMLGL